MCTRSQRLRSPSSYSLLSSGKVLIKSANLSIGAASIAAKFSKYGLLGALGWLLVGVNIFVLSNDLASRWLSSPESSFSSRGMSSFDSCSMCVWRSFRRTSRWGRNCGSEGDMVWNLYRSSLTCKVLAYATACKKAESLPLDAVDGQHRLARYLPGPCVSPWPDIRSIPRWWHGGPRPMWIGSSIWSCRLG